MAGQEFPRFGRDPCRNLWRAIIPIDLTPIQRCTSVKYTFGWSILGCTPRRGGLRDTQRNGRWGRCWLLDYKAIPGRSFFMGTDPQSYTGTFIFHGFFATSRGDVFDLLFAQHFFSCSPPKRFPNCFISLHFRPQNRLPPKDTAKYRFFVPPSEYFCLPPQILNSGVRRA